MRGGCKKLSGDALMTRLQMHTKCEDIRWYVLQLLNSKSYEEAAHE
jgi:hypothetical protein